MEQSLQKGGKEFDIRKVWKQSGSSYTITLPKDMCEKLGIKDGTYVAIQQKGAAIIVRPVKIDRNEDE